MKRKQYIKPTLLVFPVAVVSMICQSKVDIESGGQDSGTGNPEGRRHIDYEEEEDSWDW